MSGLVTIAPKQRRTGRRRRNKDKPSTTTTTTEPKPQPEIETQPIESVDAPAPVKQPKSKPSKPIASKPNKQPSQQSQASKPSKPTTIWDQRAQAKKIQQKQNPKPKAKPQSKPKTFKPTKTKPVQRKPETNNSKTTATKSSLRTGRGFSARKISHKFDPNSVDMTHKTLNKNPSKQTREEAFPSLQKGTKTKTKSIANNNKKSELQNNINKINSEKRNKRTGGYVPRKVATVYDPNSVDMAKKWDDNKNKRFSSGSNYNKPFSGGNYNNNNNNSSGLSFRSNGYRGKRTFSSENSKPQSQRSMPVENKSNETFESTCIRPKTHIVKYSG